jgi:hypothetical protein
MDKWRSTNLEEALQYGSSVKASQKGKDRNLVFFALNPNLFLVKYEIGSDSRFKFVDRSESLSGILKLNPSAYAA